MTNFEILKQLKDAGFPQDKTKWILYTIDVISARASNEDHYALRGTDLGGVEVSQILAAPTLSELIDACGDWFGQLGKASGGYNVWKLGIREPYAFGETDEEAMINFFIKCSNEGK